MNSEERPDPDALLRAISEDEQKETRAKLRVFLGMSAGVGKTYSMLRAARESMNEGIDVIIGVVETHGRKETEALLQGLPVIPKKKSVYRGTTVEEMDLDAILARKPKLVVVDELPHSNIPGSRHEKRFQDVIEILDSGIDVITAMNVQHLESRKDAVESITGIPIRETVPDSILERASQVELVDISPSQLLKRLKEGKVYLGDKAEHAAKNFFKADKLTALREIALRMTAERVDHDLQKMSGVRNESPWQTNERLLVAVSHSPYSEKLIRATRRLAYNLEAPWIAIHVDTGMTLNTHDQVQLTKNLNLARQLNAEVIATTETDVPRALQRVCRQKNVTQVVVGRPTRHWFRDVLEGGSLLDRLVRESIEVDVHVIRLDGISTYKPSIRQALSLYKTQIGPIKYWFTFVFLAAATGAGMGLETIVGYRTVGFLYLICVLIVGMFGSLGAVLFAASLSALVWNFFFIPPKYTFSIHQPDDVILCIAYFVVAIITGLLTNRIRMHEQLMREREERTNVLYEILKDIASSQEKSEFLQKALSRVGAILGADCGVILKSPNGSLEFSEARVYSIRTNEKDQAVALWSFQNRKPAGWSTDTLSESRALYIPLKGAVESVGVFVFQPLKKSRRLNLEQETLLYSITGQLGISLERHFVSKRLAEAQRLKDSEQLHQTLLNSISHEMRTPLTAILGTASALEDENVCKDPNAVKTLAVGLSDAGDRLNRVIENLLDMSRLSSGALSLNWEWHDFNDLVGVVIQKSEKFLQRHKLKVNLSDEVKLLKMDFRLIEHAISNLILNSTMYAAPNTEIKISSERQGDRFIVKIEDQGPGIPEEAVPNIFDKFYRVPGTQPGGTGLGLSIVKSIIELHKGKISYENANPGARFVITLPLLAHPPLPEVVE
ncbi:MAG TPA: sensor histidine kinase KdpD [Pseudobdellovibrionaceae bacterium]